MRRRDVRQGEPEAVQGPLPRRRPSAGEAAAPGRAEVGAATGLLAQRRSTRRSTPNRELQLGGDRGAGRARRRSDEKCLKATTASYDGDVSDFVRFRRLPPRRTHQRLSCSSSRCSRSASTPDQGGGRRSSRARRDRHVRARAAVDARAVVCQSRPGARRRVAGRAHREAAHSHLKRRREPHIHVGARTPLSKAGAPHGAPRVARGRLASGARAGNRRVAPALRRPAALAGGCRPRGDHRAA